MNIRLFEWLGTDRKFDLSSQRLCRTDRHVLKGQCTDSGGPGRLQVSLRAGGANINVASQGASWVIQTVRPDKGEEFDPFFFFNHLSILSRMSSTVLMQSVNARDTF